MPGASTKTSCEWCRWCSRSRKKSVFPCFASPTAVYSSERGFAGISVCRNCTYPEGTSMSTMKYARESEKRTEMLSESSRTVSSTSRPSASWSTGTANGVSALPFTIFPIT